MAEIASSVEDVRPWHPKITPYRLGILLTTIGFGTAKVIEARTGNSMIPTTLEWLGGTVIFLVFFGFSSYDGKERDVPSQLRWLFEPDCMEILWIALSSLSIERPKYTSIELEITTPQYNHSRHITTYRLLVSCTVFSFGMFKATLSYLGPSLAATWTDWSIAVPLTTIFYILGLYEYNSSDIWRSFYVTDRTESFNYYTKHSFVVAGYTLWGISSSSGLVYLSYNPDAVFRSPHNLEIDTNKTRSLSEIVFYHTMIYIVKATLLGMTGVALHSLFFYSPALGRLMQTSIGRTGKAVNSGTRLIFRSVVPLLPISVKRTVGRREMHSNFQGYLQTLVSVSSNVFSPRLSSHVFLHALALGICVLYTGLITGVTLELYDDILLYPSRTILGTILSAVMFLIILPVDVALIGGTLFLVYSLFFRFDW